MDEFIEYLNKDPISRGSLKPGEKDSPYFYLCMLLRRTVINHCTLITLTSTHFRIFRANKPVAQFELFGFFDYRTFFLELVERDALIQRYVQLLQKTEEEYSFLVILSDAWQALYLSACQGNIAGKSKANNPSLARILITTLNYRGEDKNWRKIQLLQDLNDDQVLSILVHSLKTEEKNWRVKIPFALARLANNAIVPPLLEALENDSEGEVRGEAAWVLGFTYDLSVIPALLKALGDSDSYLRTKAVQALGNLCSSSKGKNIYSAATDRESGTKFIENYQNKQKFAIDASTSNRKVIPAITQLLHDEVESVRTAAITSLGLIGDPESVQFLIEAFNEDSTLVRVSIAKALGLIGNDQAIEALEKALADSDIEVRLSVLKAFGTLRNPKPLVSLIHLLHTEQESSIRELIVYVLWQIGTEAVVEPLIQALDDSSPDVRYIAALALSQVGTLHAVPLLLQMQQNDNGITSKNLKVKDAVREALKFILNSIAEKNPDAL